MTGLSPALLPLRARFVGLNPARVDELLGLRAQAAGGPDATRALLAIGEIAHKICGVAATLGFGRIGALAFDLDQAVIALRDRQSDAAAAWRNSQPLLDALIAALRAEDGGPPCPSLRGEPQ